MYTRRNTRIIITILAITAILILLISTIAIPILLIAILTVTIVIAIRIIALVVAPLRERRPQAQRRHRLQVLLLPQNAGHHLLRHVHHRVPVVQLRKAVLVHQPLVAVHPKGVEDLPAPANRPGK